MQNIKEALQKPDLKFDTYNRCAAYYLDHSLDAPQALQWAQRSVELDTKFYNLFTLARAQQANGKKEEAKATADRAIEMAVKEGDDGAASSYRQQLASWK